MKAFTDERNSDLIFLVVFCSLFQCTELIAFFGKRVRNEGEAKREGRQNKWEQGGENMDK